MLRLRPYKDCDAETIVSWVGDEISFRKWCADRFDRYPITAEDLKSHYHALDDSDSFFEMTAFDETGVVGHMIMRFTDEQKSAVRFGFVIVDRNKRGKGYGHQMLELSKRYAFDILKAEKITLGVFENNPSAYRCYRAAGFREVSSAEETFYPIMGENWKCVEMELARESR